MSNVRLIARLDIKGPNLIKGVRLEGLRKLGDPQVFAEKYYNAGIDELLYIDVVASLYERDSLREIVRRTAENVFIPLTVGGGIRSVDDVTQMLRAGADKVAINTAATKRPELIQEVARRFGSQCMVLSVEAKKIAEGKWEAYTDNGREKTGFDVIEWLQKAVDLGCGEILLTSVDQEGTKRGFDLDLIKAAAAVVPVPLIASGGAGSAQHVVEAVKEAGADAVALAHLLHYDKIQLPELRQNMMESGIAVRCV